MSASWLEAQYRLTSCLEDILLDRALGHQDAYYCQPIKLVSSSCVFGLIYNVSVFVLLPVTLLGRGFFCFFSASAKQVVARPTMDIFISV